MSKIYRGNVGIKPVKATDGSVAIRLIKYADGPFNAENAMDIFKVGLEASKKQKRPLFSWSFWYPAEERVIKQTDAKLVADGKVEPVLHADHYGKPKLVLLPPKKFKASRPKTEQFDWIV
tara:strand:- start:290 stop:649 length:360 start_codon:yes stop_codon:yes gene_type:complete